MTVEFDWRPYQGREQTGVKHFILREYLERFAPIIAHRWDTITYVDCFSGPWNAETTNYDDTSFSIALRELKRARGHKRKGGGDIKLRAMFIEKHPKAFRELSDFCNRRGSDNVDVQLRPGTLESNIGNIVQFVQGGGRGNFPFIFIDPTGWTGFSLAAITPLLRLKPCEVLINFMTKDITRFFEHPDEKQRQTFVDLYGRKRFDTASKLIVNRDGIEREELLVSEYMAAIRETGEFKFSSSAIVLNPESARTHFHLIYATRNAKGIEVFKATEKRAMDVMLDQRSGIQERKSDTKKTQASQGGFDFSVPKEPNTDQHLESLRERYLRVSRSRVLHQLRTTLRIDFGTLESTALEVPLTFVSDLKSWISSWRMKGALRLEGLPPGARAPQSDTVVVWTDPIDLTSFPIERVDNLSVGVVELDPVVLIKPAFESAELGYIASCDPFSFRLCGTNHHELLVDFNRQFRNTFERLWSLKPQDVPPSDQALFRVLKNTVRTTLRAEPRPDDDPPEDAWKPVDD